jgi:GWxTD domain-containing protein
MQKIKYIVLLMSVLSMAAIAQDNPKEKSKRGKKNTTAATVEIADEITILGIKSKFLAKDSTLATVFMQIDVSKSNSLPVGWKEFTTKFTLNYVLYPDFASRERLGYGNVALSEQNTYQLSSRRFMVRFEIKRPQNHANGVLLSELAEIGTTKKILNDLAIRFKTNKISDEFTFFEKTGRIPTMQNFINVNDTLRLQNINQTPQQLLVMRYRHNFEAAASPMSTNPRVASRTLSVDSTFFINTAQPLAFAEEGLYYMTRDTSDAYGIGLVVTNKRYPKFTRPAELIRPVMYMSQNQEISELTNAQDAKKALDRYWLGLMNGNQDLARRTISVFYHRVEEANRLFTTYKEGWKTDKGMIFIVMGPPDRVQRSKDREVWVYAQRANFSEINFTFNRRPNQFVEDHYELQRYVEYQPIWYPMVEAWRTGAVRE